MRFLRIVSFLLALPCGKRPRGSLWYMSKFGGQLELVTCGANNSLFKWRPFVSDCWCKLVLKMSQTGLAHGSWVQGQTLHTCKNVIMAFVASPLRCQPARRRGDLLSPYKTNMMVHHLVDLSSLDGWRQWKCDLVGYIISLTCRSVHTVRSWDFQAFCPFISSTMWEET